MRLNVIYRGITRCTLGDGLAVSFWDNLWSDSVLSLQYPRMHLFTRDGSISVQNLMLEQDLSNVFALPLSVQVYDELLLLQSHLEGIEYDDSSVDTWSWTWGIWYTSRQFYAHAFSGVEACPFYKMLWKSSCTPRVKLFAWLILVDQLNTKMMLRRRHLNIQDDALCVMCDTGLEEDY